MRQARMKLEGCGYYHCISRVVDRRFIFEGEEKEQFVHWMTAYAGFCGVRVLTYCILSNHFHLLVEVPLRPEELPDEEELLRRYGLIHGEETVERMRTEMASWPVEQRREWFEGLLGQMWDLSAYMKLVKQRFSQWYNRRMDRKGTLWEERFKSVIVEGSREALARVAAYIDLNPVRARLVEDPQEYRWSGYAAAVAGRRVAREGIGGIIHLSVGAEGTLTEAMAMYRMWVYGEGLVEGIPSPDGPPIRAGISPEKVREVLAARGKLSWGDYVRCRVRYFTDGTVIGSRAWVNEVFEQHRQRFGPRRKDGARKFRFLADQSLFGLRDLHNQPVTLNR